MTSDIAQAKNTIGLVNRVDSMSCSIAYVDLWIKVKWGLDLSIFLDKVDVVWYPIASMKKLFAGLAFALISLFVSPQVGAYEGHVEMQDENVSCKATSVWRENDYKVVGRCDGLVYPYQTKFEHYVIWAHEVESDSLVKLSEVDRGYFEGNMKNSFDRLVISAEENGTPRRPSDKIVIEGGLVRFSFDKSEVEIKTPAEVVSPAEVSEEPAAAGEQSTVGKVIGRILAAVFVIVLVVVGIVVVSSLLFRRRGSVST